MKKFGLVAFLTLIFVSAFSQVPEKFSYQAVIRDASGVIRSEVNVTIQIRILQGSANGTAIYSESHSTRTNTFGLVNLEIGGGTIESGTFSSIDWAAGPYYLNIKVNGTDYGTIQMLSVPYAMYAKKAANGFSGQWADLTGKPPFQSNGDTIYLMKNMALGSDSPKKSQLAVVSKDDSSDDPLFEVRRKDGQPVFSVYNDAVTINVPFPGTGKGSPSRGGFAIGGFDAAKGAFVTDLFRVTPDSIRMYINSNPSTGKGTPSRGGFAVGGFDAAKAASYTELLRITRDSTRIYTSDPDKGFGIGAIGESGSDNYLLLKPENYFIGQKSGLNTTTGLYNTFFGYEAGLANTSGSSNVFIGYQSGTRNTTGNYNMFIGRSSGFMNMYGEKNIFLGDFAGYSNSGGTYSWMGSDNIFIGSNAGQGNTQGAENIFIGTSAGSANSTGNLNIYIGHVSGFHSTGMRNTFIGAYSGESNTIGEDNIFIGNQTGQSSTTGINNTFIGSLAGWVNGTGRDNTFLGYNSGSNMASGTYNVALGSCSGMGPSGNRNVYIGYATGGKNSLDGNIFIGFEAGANETNGNRLYIENSGSVKTDALIYGEFDTDVLFLNATVTVRDVLKLPPRKVAPATPSEGDIYYDYNDHKLKVWNGTAWMSCW